MTLCLLTCPVPSITPQDAYRRTSTSPCNPLYIANVRLLPWGLSGCAHEGDVQGSKELWGCVVGCYLGGIKGQEPLRRQS